jgi:tRNA/rRNA methyltransferase
MITVVLVETEGEENIGAVARAMMNMDVDCLALVNPRCDHLSKNALNYAVHASEILEQAKVFTSLREALEDADLSAAITRRTGQWRKRDFIIEDFSNFLAGYKDRNVSLVFGREKYGLTNEEIRSADLICSIPSSDKFPSINLSQAVMITLYDIYRTNLHKPSHTGKLTASREQYAIMLESIMSAFDEMDFFRTVPSWRLKNYINKILIRAGLDGNDCLIIKNLFTRVRGKFQSLLRQGR